MKEKPVRNKMPKNKNFYIKWTAILLFIGSFGASFDAYWHLSGQVESLFAFPHLFIHIGAIGTIFLGWKAYSVTSNVMWKHLAVIATVLPIAGLIDTVLHAYREVENPRDVTIVWSPPHLLIFIAAMAGLFLFSLLLRKESSYKHNNTLGPAFVGLFLNVTMIFFGPFLPAGPHQILGNLGVIVTAFIVILTFLTSASLFKKSYAATITAFVFVFMQMLIYDVPYTPGDTFLHIPTWLVTMVYLIPAFMIDNWNIKLHTITAGAFAGLIHGLLFFGLGGVFIPNNNFTYMDLGAGSFVAAIGGLLAGVAISLIEIRTASSK